jgi:hypothetical protein
MQPFEIFKAGKQTASNGAALDFSEDMLKAAVEAYDPALHEAPIVVGHPKDNHPAYGWIKSLSFADGQLIATPDQLDPEFSEMVTAGRFKKRSASFYLPDSPNNPKPGTLYLRHVGFLGAQPPAVKGLKDVSFAEEEGVVEFGDSSPWIWSRLAETFRGIREWIIEEKGIDAANKIISAYTIDDLNNQAEMKRNAPEPQIPAIPSFTEDNTMTPEQQKQLDDLKAENEVLKAQSAKLAEFSEKEKSIADREAALARKEIEGKVDGMITAGKVLPANKSQLVDFMSSLQDAEAVVEFGEGEKVEKFSQRAFFEKFLNDQPKVVEFEEKAPREDGINPGDLSNEEVAKKAVEFQEAEAKAGRQISATEAVTAVRAGKTK